MPGNPSNARCPHPDPPACLLLCCPARLASGRADPPCAVLTRLPASRCVHVHVQLARDVELLQPNGCDATLLAERLRVLGYDAMVRATRGGLTPQPSGGGRPAASGRVFGSLRHEFVVVVVSEAPPLGMSRMGLGAAAGAAAARLRKAATAELSREIVVDVRFREQFEVPKPTAAYAALLARAPRVFVGSLFALLQAGMELAAGLEASFAEAGLPLPPWRRRDVLLSKWASAAAVGTAGGRSAPGTPWRSGDWAVAADAAAAGAPAAGLPHAPDMVRALSWSPPQVSAPEAGTRVAAAVPRTIKVGFPE
eukprot:366279-Chlamydomonas_euryale.AAC.3